MKLIPRYHRALRHSLLGLSIASALVLPGCSNTSFQAGDLAAAPAPVKKKPNILYIMADDLGYSDLGAFGGEISTPNLDALAQQGRLLTNHHTGTVCAITRAMLVSGTDHHLVGEGHMGAPNDERRGLPGYEGFLNDSALSFAQLLRDGGYHTYMAGKWHIGSALAGGNVAAAGKTPDQWGFEHSFALLPGAAANHYAHEAAGSTNYTEDGKYVQPGQPGQPGGEPFYSTDFYTKRLISYIDQHKADGKPFFAYAAYTSPHWPLQVSEPYLSKYKGKYDAGYDAIRDARIARQKQLGLIPADFKPFAGAAETLTASPATAAFGATGAKYINANNGVAQSFTEYGKGKVVKNWSSLTPLERKAQARYMEIYAGMVDNLDHNIGLLIQHLKDIGEYENTYIMFQSDNGAEGWPVDGGADPKATDEANAVEPVYSTLGTDNGLQAAKRLQYGIRWAEVSATPFRLTKGYAGEGSVSTPLIVHLPGQTKALPNLNAVTHVTDNTATFLALAGITLPTEAAPKSPDPQTGVDRNLGKVVYQGRNVYPVTGKSLLPLLEGSVQSVRSDALGDEAYGRAYLISGDGKWKALWNEPPVGPLDGHWELFDLTRDRGETTDLSAKNPAVTGALVGEWQQYMKRVGGVEPLKPQGYY